MIITTRTPAVLESKTASLTPSRSGSMDAQRPHKVRPSTILSNLISVSASRLKGRVLPRGRVAMAKTRRACSESSSTLSRTCFFPAASKGLTLPSCAMYDVHLSRM